MAEIILPPEENEEILPQEPDVNIEKPTKNSKVITVEFEAKKTLKTQSKDTRQQLYTTDTDAWFEFKETSLGDATGTYSVVFRNLHDGSIFQRTGDVVNGVAYYKIPEQEIRHAGKWLGQLVYTLENGNTTAREFGYDVKGHILDGKDVREIVVEDFETLMTQLNGMKNNAEAELASVITTIGQNETNRQELYDDLVEDINELQSNYTELLDTGVLQTNINNKLEDLETEYAPKLTEVSAQLAQTEYEIASKIARGKGQVTSADLSQDVKEQLTGGSVAVVGKNAVLSENIVDGQVTPEKIPFYKKTEFSNLFSTFNIQLGMTFNSDGEVVPGSNRTVSDYIPVKAGTTYTFVGGVINRLYEYDSNKSNQRLLGTSLSSTSTFTPTIDGYVRFSIQRDDLEKLTTDFKLAEESKFGRTIQAYEMVNPYLKIEERNMSSAIIGGEHIKSKTLAVRNMSFLDEGSNLFDKDSAVLGRFITGGGGESQTPGYFTSHIIHANGSTDWTIKYVRTYEIYSSDGVRIDGANTGSNTSVITIQPPVGGYFIFSGIVSLIDEVQVNKGTELLDYEPYYVEFPSLRQGTGEAENNIKPIQTKRDGDVLRIVSKKDGDTLVNFINLKGSGNGSLNLEGVSLNGTMVHNFTDDITPIRTVSTVGANHGYTTSVVGDSFPDNMSSGGQLLPSVKNIEQEILEKYDKVVIKESYEILDHVSLLDWKDNNPTRHYVDFLDDIESSVKVITQYTFYDFGKCSVDTTLVFLKDTPINNIGFLQSARIHPSATRYVPGVEVSEYDFESGLNLQNLDSTVNIVEDDFKFAGEPPLFYTDVNNNVKYTMGYIPEQNATDEARLSQTDRFWDFRSTGKSYPVAINNTLSPVEAGTVYQVSGFRNYTFDEDDLITFEVVESGECWYVFIYSVDAHNIISKTINVPSNKGIEVIRSHGVELMKSTTGGGGIVFSTQEKSNALFKILK